ncbi:hypothetical protein [Halonatronum saccharophilum]|uniref:hypothetical protein n=1 Tax=Halonatronum saccharophilum TaxID=150060 RepID=UPI0004807B48|nr:hypothetical protein [Halonatronum saccharophilum]
MKVYYFDKATKELTGIGEANISPANPSKFLIPANATDVPPPDCEKGEVVIFNQEENQWEIKVDYRGQRFWDKDGNKITITDLGTEIEEGWYSSKPQFLIDSEEKEKKKQEIKSSINHLEELLEQRKQNYVSLMIDNEAEEMAEVKEEITEIRKELSKLYEELSE